MRVIIPYTCLLFIISSLGYASLEKVSSNSGNSNGTAIQGLADGSPESNHLIEDIYPIRKRGEVKGELEQTSDEFNQTVIVLHLDIGIQENTTQTVHAVCRNPTGGPTIGRPKSDSHLDRSLCEMTRRDLIWIFGCMLLLLMAMILGLLLCFSGMQPQQKRLPPIIDSRVAIVHSRTTENYDSPASSPSPLHMSGATHTNTKLQIK